tara:strand:- start:569 stop:2068 length:1500 start_codon:yes stop_codon:yes gene_type:complete
MSFSKIIYFLILVSTSTIVARAQQMEYNSHYIYNPYLLNPSLIGEGQKNIFLGYRKQWSGFVGAPEIQQISFDSPLDNNKSAIGFRILNDVTNIIGKTSGYLTYKYKVRLSKKSDFSFALSGGFFQNRILFDQIIASDKFESIIFESNQKLTGFDADFGFNYRFEKFIIGATTKNIFQNTIVYFNDNNSNNLNYSFIRQFNIHSQYTFSFKGDDLHLTPILLLQSVQGIPFNYEGNLLFDFKNKFFLNFNYSHQISSGISASVLLDDAIQLSYTFELPTKSLQSYGFNSQEISLKFLMHKNNNFSNLKDIEDLKNQSNSLFEKTDFMEQNQIKSNLNIDNNRDSINALKDSLNSVVFGLENVIKNLKYDKSDLDSIIKYYSENIENDSDSSNTTFKSQVQKPISSNSKNQSVSENIDSNKSYYIIIGAYKELKNAIDYKQIFMREYNLESKIMRNKLESWYYLYTETSSNKQSLKVKVKELLDLDVNKIITNNPWIYFE